MVNILDRKDLYDKVFPVKGKEQYKTLTIVRDNPDDPDDPIEIVFEYREITNREYLEAMTIGEDEEPKKGKRQKSKIKNISTIEDMGKRQVFIFNSCIRNWEIVDLEPQEADISLIPPQFSIWCLLPSEANALMDVIVPSYEKSDIENISKCRITIGCNRATDRDSTKRIVGLETI